MEHKYDVLNFKKDVAKLYASKAYIELNHSIKQTDFFKVLGVSRNELCHSQFIAWILDPNGSHGLGDFSLRRFLQLLAIKKNSKQNEKAELPKELENYLIVDKYEINRANDYKVITEYPIVARKKKNGKQKENKSKDRIDILVKGINLSFDNGNNEKEIFILIENKVKATVSDGQTQHYYDWANDRLDGTVDVEDDRPEGMPLCVFLSPGKKNTKPDCDKFIRITYQDLVELVIEPCMLKTTSEISKAYMQEYLKTLSYSTETDKNGERKGELVMAFSKDETMLCENFVNENIELLTYVADVLRSSEKEDSLVEDIVELQKVGRDTTKYSLDGEGRYGKGRIALKIIQNAALEYTTYKGLMDRFEKAFKMFGYGQDRILIDDLSRDGIDESRFFTKDDEQILLDNKVYYFTTQWGKSKAFDELLRIAREELGYDIKEIDYKTDHIGSKTVDELKLHLSRCYDNQQELYRYAVSKMLGIPISDITYQYYHLYDN